MRRSPSLLLAAVLALVACAAEARPRPDVRFAQVGERKVAYAVIGDAGPTLVFIAGLGDGLQASRKLAQRLSAHARVVVYDRAGYGDSAPLTTPADGAQTTAELDAVLTAAGAREPVVLIGHSIGGQFAELYASAKPERVAALVLDDSRPGPFTADCLAALARAQCAPPAFLAKLFPPAMRREYAGAGRFEAELAAVRPYAGPVLVLSRHPGAGPVEALWANEQADLARRYRAVQATAPKGGHYVHDDAAAWFDQQIERFVSGLKSAR